ncbi:hypothetical protein KSF73_10965 [Burkholderiaceae bacterium DAT-1]|nr:hypothetical protein [Burkholderiaceae bacterium DAT-1]
MRIFAYLVMGFLMMVQSVHADIGALLGSGRNDLWVFGVDENRSDRSVKVQLEAVSLPLENWKWVGQLDARSNGKVLYSERPSGWRWREAPWSQLGRQFYYHLSKYDDHSAFSFDWGVSAAADGSIIYNAAILSFDDGKLVLIPDGLKVARVRYGLSESQDFVGMVDNKIFFYDHEKPSELFFFDQSQPKSLFRMNVPVNKFWSSSWKVEQVEQVFNGGSVEEITAQIRVKNTAWFSAKPRRDFAGIVLNLKTAVPVN